MPTYIVLLRAVNVGGYGKLAMADFRKLLEELGFKNVETYIQSGNAVFDAKGSAATVAKLISAALEKHTGAPVVAGEAITVKAGRLGSYFLTRQPGPTMRVKRLQ